ncbi:MAG: tripartite tricarboxylate transporter TctB family protein [Burkholderiales bacterium]|nr:tripartite tricarboxylate transporter TctB family protein [Burkholderiales bacterium]
MSEPSTTAPAEGVRTTTVEAVVAAILLALGLVTATESWRLGARWTDDGPGAGYFPFYIAVVMSLASAGILVKALRQRSGDTEVFVDRRSLKQVLQVLVPAALYVLAVQFIGIYVASALYIALFMVLLGRFDWPRSLGVGLGVCVVFFLMFEVWFKVPLFKGALNPTGFLGY